MFYSIQVGIWAVLIIAICSRIQSKKSTLLLSALSSLLFTAEMLAIYLNGRFIDYQFYTHLSLDSLRDFGFQFTKQIISFLILWSATTFLTYILSRKIQASPLKRNRYFIPTISMCFIFLSIPNGILHEKYSIYQILSAEQKEFENALQELGVPPNEYVYSQNLKATKGKNVIVISMESLEQGFLKNEFAELTPNLNRLAQQWSFYGDFPALPGSTWTAGSLYSYLTGVPAFFANHGNQSFQNTTNVKLTGLGHVLEKAGYNSIYIMGKPEFAGTADILKAYKFPIISEKNVIGSYPPSPAGLHDKDLFAEAKLQIGRLKNSKRPFAVFMSTINTHFPAGIHDARMEKHIPNQHSNLEFAVASLDYLIGDFLHYLETEGILENTIVYLFPDHPLMGSSAIVEKLKKEKRQAYLITNAAKKEYPLLHHVDLPRVIIEGAGIQTNARFLSDYIPAKERENFFRSNQRILTSLNEASVAKINFQGGIKITADEGALSISSSTRKIAAARNSKKKTETFNFIFSSEMEPIEWKKVDPNRALALDQFDQRHKRLHLLITVTDDEITSYLGNKYTFGLSKAGKSPSYSIEEIAAIISSNKTDHFRREEPKERKFEVSNGIIAVTSSEFITNQNIKSELIYNGSTFHPRRGLNVFYKDSERGYILKNYDTYASQQEFNLFIDKITSLISKKDFWITFSHDAVRNNWPGASNTLKKIGLKKLSDINHRVAYIAYSDETGATHEFSAKDSISHYIKSFERAPSDEEKKALQERLHAKTKAANLRGKDKSRFIAHAGGSIDGRNYTNSLEALNLNYKKGFRLFELDIIKTADDRYVAAHDWKHWSKITGYTGETPPTRETFLQQKIFEKYTPIDLEKINDWFQKHPDAILVTDKVNEPLHFSERFIDRKRLIMELFTWDAVQEGKQANIKAVMPTASLLNQIKSSKTEHLKSMGITHVAASRRLLSQQTSLIDELAAAGVKIFAFHINFDKRKDENYVVCHEFDYFYGLYADKWDFSTPITCTP